MMKKIEIDLQEAIRVFKIMEEINDFFHQPEKYQDVDQFADKNYGEIREVFYNVMWNWLPPDTQEEIMEG